MLEQRVYKLVFQRWNDALTHITVECPTKFFLGLSQKCLTLRLDKWMVRMFEYGFEENIDYMPVSQKRLTAQGNETTFTDYIVTIDMAKEIFVSMPYFFSQIVFQQK